MEKTPKNTAEAFEDACEDIYHAIRNTFGYGDTADYLIDWVGDMADAWETNNKQKLAKRFEDVEYDENGHVVRFDF